MDLRYQVDRIEDAEALDGAVDRVGGVVDRLLPANRRLRDVLHGTWLGHPLHPVLTDVVLGCWTSAMVCDALGEDEAAEGLVGLGVLSALPTAAAGWADWQALGEFKAPRRVGLVHAASNSVALACYGASWVQRRRGRRRSGVLLSLLGASTAGLGGYLGGHLAYRQRVGVSHVEADDAMREWRRVARLDDVPDGGLARASVDGADVVLHRRGFRVWALAATCSHMGGPLDEGSVEEAGGEPCVRCPWHDSVFRLADGGVRHGPATSPQPAYEVRVRTGEVWVRLRPVPAGVHADEPSGSVAEAAVESPAPAGR